MPPRKKQKVSSQGVSTPSQTEDSQPTPQPAAAPKEGTDQDAIANDPWTDEQETSLLKGVIRWKPVGMHKHFRMLAISDYMTSQGHVLENEQHTRIPGIWKKMSTLYNLEALDDREDPFSTDGNDSQDPAAGQYCPFELPEDEYGEMMFERRLAPNGSESPQGSERGASARPSTAADADEPRSSPAPSRGRRGGRRSRGGRGGRSSRLHVEADSSKSQSSEKASPGNEEGNAESDEGEEEGDATDANKDESEAESPAPRSTRTQTARAKSSRGKPAGRRGGRRR